MRLEQPLDKFVDQLPIPEVIQPAYKTKMGKHYDVTMKEVKQKLHRDLPETTVWGYNGSYPGPTFEVQKSEPISVKWMNDLPVEKHLLPVDTTIHGAGLKNPTVRTVVHLHGGKNPPDSDGYPESWFTNNFKQVGPTFTQKIYYYPNKQSAATLWYHDHALGITRLNVYAGLAGFYLVRDKIEKGLNLPKGNYEIPLVIQDRSFNTDGSLYYPSTIEDSQLDLPDPSIVPEFFGDHILVNGKVWPFLNVEPRKYRFRILNGSNSRFYNISLDSKQSMYQIGTDGGFLEKSIELKEIILGPGERADVILDFSKNKGQHIIMKNSAKVPFPNGEFPDENTTANIMQFRVVEPLKEEDTSNIPNNIMNIEPVETNSIVRNLSLNEGKDEFGRLLLLLDNSRWVDPIVVKPKRNSIETWNLINTTPDTHPIHLHLVQFQILHRQEYNVNKYIKTGEIEYTSEPIPPDLNEQGFKDTVRANPGEITTIVARFGPYTGVYPWHCHILEHEDHEMMLPYEVVNDKQVKDNI